MSIKRILAKVSRKNFLRAGLIAGGGLAGGVHGFYRGEPGLKSDSTSEGFKIGVAVGTATAFSPSIGRVLKRAFKTETARMTSKAGFGGKVIFKRIRGRIVPIRVKR